MVVLNAEWCLEWRLSPILVMKGLIEITTIKCLELEPQVWCRAFKLAKIITYLSIWMKVNIVCRNQDSVRFNLPDTLCLNDCSWYIPDRRSKIIIKIVISSIIPCKKFVQVGSGLIACIQKTLSLSVLYIQVELHLKHLKQVHQWLWQDLIMKFSPENFHVKNFSDEIHIDYLFNVIY